MGQFSLLTSDKRQFSHLLDESLCLLTCKLIGTNYTTLRYAKARTQHNAFAHETKPTTDLGNQSSYTNDQIVIDCLLSTVNDCLLSTVLPFADDIIAAGHDRRCGP